MSFPFQVTSLCRRTPLRWAWERCIATISSPRFSSRLCVPCLRPILCSKSKTAALSLLYQSCQHSGSPYQSWHGKNQGDVWVRGRECLSVSVCTWRSSTRWPFQPPLSPTTPPPFLQLSPLNLGPAPFNLGLASHTAGNGRARRLSSADPALALQTRFQMRNTSWAWAHRNRAQVAHQWRQSSFYHNDRGMSTKAFTRCSSLSVPINNVKMWGGWWMLQSSFVLSRGLRLFCSGPKCHLVTEGC